MRRTRYKPLNRKVLISRHLRMCMTPCERLLSERLLSRGFKAQVILYGFVVDFYHPVYRLVIEADGSSHSGREDYDSERDEVMRSHGNIVLRFSNRDILSDTNRVVARIDGCIVRLRQRGSKREDKN